MSRSVEGESGSLPANIYKYIKFQCQSSKTRKWVNAEGGWGCTQNPKQFKLIFLAEGYLVGGGGYPVDSLVSPIVHSTKNLRNKYQSFREIFFNIFSYVTLYKTKGHLGLGYAVLIPEQWFVQYWSRSSRWHYKQITKLYA